MPVDEVRAEFLRLLDQLLENKRRVTEVNTITRSTEGMDAKDQSKYQTEVASIETSVPALLDLLNTMAEKLTDCFIGRRTRALVKNAASEAIYAALGGTKPDASITNMLNRQPN